MAIILPKEGSIWETLGTGLGSGLEALAQGKVQQMQKRNYANSLQQMGFSPDIAYLPEKLQPLAMKQHLTGLKSLAKQQQDQALFEQGVNLGGDPDMLRQAHAAGNLSQVVGKLTNAENPSYAQRAGITSSKTNQFRLSPEKQKVNQLAQELSGSSGVAALQNMGQQQGGLSQLSSQVNETQDFTPAEQILMQKMNDPNIPAEKRQEMREALQAAKGRDWGYGIGALAGSIGNFASNAASSIGSLGGLPSLLESAAAPLAKNIFAPIVRSEIEGLKKSAEGMDKGSEEYKQAQEKISSMQKELDAPITYSAPTAASIKEDFVRPIAKALGVENQIDPKNPLETLFGRLGSVAPALAVSSLLSGGSAAANLLRQSKIAGLAEGAGQLTEAITGSKIAGNTISLLGYVVPGLVKPGFFDRIVNKGYESFRGFLKNNANAKIDASPLMQDLQPIRDAIAVDPESKGYRFLTGRLRAIEKNVGDISEASAAFRGGLRQDVNPKKLFDLDQAFGKQYSHAEQLGVSAEFQQMREMLRKTYQQWAGGIDPAVTDGLIGARATEQALRSRTALEKVINVASDTRVPLLSSAGYALKFVANTLKYPAKYLPLLLKNPNARGDFYKLLSAAANDNKAGMYESAKRIHDVLRTKSQNK